MRHFYLIALATISVVSSSQAMGEKKKKKTNPFQSFIQLAQVGENGQNILKAAEPLFGIVSTLMEEVTEERKAKLELKGEQGKMEYNLALKKIELKGKKADSEAKRVQSLIEFMQTMLEQSKKESADKSDIIKVLITVCKLE